MSAAHQHAHDIPCPDPSVHEKSNQLSAQASTAALYVTHPERATETRLDNTQENPLGPDGKLSSKSAAASLRYAKPRDLPSFPTTGASADSAGKAAMLAKDYKMKDLWQPEQSLAGSKAAVLAQAKGGKLDLWQASASANGHAAATLAMRNKGLSPATYTGVDADNRNKALLAATMSASKGRQRAESTPAPPPASYPDAHNSTANALNAATVSHRTSTLKSSAADGWDSDAMQAARIKNSHMEREMFGSAPPVDIERDEARHQAALRASAVSMAKQIYDSQDRNVMVADPADVAGAQAAAGRSSTSSAGPVDLKQEAMRYISLQETAHKLAAERLAKVDKSLEDSRYREYYGYGDKPKRLSNRMSLRSVGGGRPQRKRASSDTTSRYDDSDDEEQARRIRTQMSQLSTGLGQVDQKKQQDDRARLLAAAEKRVSQRMHNMDEKVFADTGKVPPALMEEWEAKARERAQKERELQAQNPGKTHIGGGKFMDQSEIEAIAAARLKPTLDDINDTAEKKRAHDEEVRLEKEAQERERWVEKQNKKEEKEEQKRIKNEEKVVAKQQKDEEKARKAEEKRIAKEDKRKSRDVKKEEAKGVAAATAGGAALAEVAEKVKDDDEPEHEGTAAEGVQRHRSAISRLKDRFRRHDEAEDEQETKPHTSTAEADGAATGAVTAATLNEVADEEPLDSQQAAYAVASEEAAKESVESPTPVAAQTHSSAALVAESSKAVEPAESKDDKWRPVAAPTAAAVGAAAVAPAIIVDDDDDDDDEEVSEARKTRPTFGQTPSLSGFHNDEVPRAKPDLERHISHIPESDDSDEDDEDWNDERVVSEPKTTTLGDQRAQEIADRVAAAPAAASSTATAPFVPETIAEKSTEPTIAPAPVATEPIAEKSPEPTVATTSTAAAPDVAAPIAEKSAEPEFPINESHEKTLAQLNDQRAEHPKDLPATIESPGVPKPSASADSDEPESKLKTEKKDHSILRQIINPGGDKYDETAFGENAKEVPAEELREEEKPKDRSILRQIINPGGEKYDPVAFSAPKESTEEKPSSSTAAAATTAPAVAAATASHEEKPSHAKLTKSSPATQESDKEKKGLRGFFNKLGSRKSKGENRYPDFKSVSKSEAVPYQEHKAAQKPVSGTIAAAAKTSQAPKAESSPAAAASTSTTLPPVETGPAFSEEHIGTDGPIGDKSKVSGLNGNPAAVPTAAATATTAVDPDSPSSFNRNETTTHDPDDVSSSGADEDDLQRGRGRGGRIASKLGFGVSRTFKNDKKQPGKLTPLTTGRQGSSATDADETFEEARDHFDENLAPPPAFAGQAKSESPVRETRFQEQL